MSTNKPNAETHYQCKEIAKERDTYRDMCTELLQLMKLYSNNGDKIQSMVFKSAITKAESILGG